MSANANPDPEQSRGQALFVEATPVQSMPVTIKNPVIALTREERMGQLERELDQLRRQEAAYEVGLGKRKVFDGVEIPRKRPFVPSAEQRSSEADKAAPEASKDKGKQKEKVADESLPPTAPLPPSQPHPYANLDKPRYAGPSAERNMGVPDRYGQSFRATAPIVDQEKTRDIFDKCLGAPVT
ncbi:hypothetical protein H0H92_015074, partial [Tricholoma furcatifolium]